MEKWQIELRHCIRTYDELRRRCPDISKAAFRSASRAMRFSITPHTADLIDWSDSDDPLFRMAVPSKDELKISPEELEDPIFDDAHSPLPFLIHRFPDRALILAAFVCAGFCRFCFRRSKTGRSKAGPSDADFAKIRAYISDRPLIKEVILSGGDPLMLSEQKLSSWLSALSKIKNLKILRIHTRLPVTLPSRITPSLVKIFKTVIAANNKLVLVTHFNHPREIAPANIKTIRKLLNAGVIVKNQSVLLRGVNDNSSALEELFRRLWDIGVSPYYLHQLDLARGTNHFRVPVEKGIYLIKRLKSRASDIALPQYVIDLPGGLGKIPINETNVARTAPGKYEITVPSGQKIAYQEPR
jgi:lysine 2,3-aminomutase